MNRDLNEVREYTPQISGGKEFQAKRTANAKILKLWVEQSE